MEHKNHIELDFHDMHPRHPSMSWKDVVEVKFNEEAMSWNYVVGNRTMSHRHVVETSSASSKYIVGTVSMS